MTLNIDLEDVPDAILEAVKARIMANRRRLLDRQELLRQPPLQPKPQFRKFGADSKMWKRPQPAAVPDEGRRLPYFYQSIFDPGGFLRPGERTITMWSGNGKQSVTATLEDPFPTFSDLELPEGVAAWANRPIMPGFEERRLGPLARAGGSAFPPSGYTGTGRPLNEVRTYGLYSTPSDGLTEVGQYSISRYESLSTSSYTEYFPLGNGKCLVVIVFRDALISEIIERGYSTVFNKPSADPWFPSFNSDIFEFIDYNNTTTEYDADIIRSAAFVCSITEARQVSIPASLENEIKSRAPRALQQTPLISLRGLQDWWNAFAINYQYSIANVRGYWRNLGGDQNFPPPSKNKFPAYGWLNQGVQDATPSSWITIGSTPLANYDTHEEIQSHQIDSKSVGSLIRRGYYYGILDGFNSTDPPSQRLLFWGQGLPTGDLLLPALPDPSGPLGEWRATVNQAPRFGLPDTADMPGRVYIHDWGNPAFCRQQAQRWGVADL